MKVNRVLVLAEHDNQTLKVSTANTVRAATELSEDITVLVAGYQCAAVAKAASLLDGVNEVWVSDLPCFEHGLAENVAELMIDLAEAFQYILAPATTYGKNILPRVAARLDVAQISEITGILSPDTFVRPIYAGNALLTIQSLDPIKVITVRSTAFEAVSTGVVATKEPAPIVNLASKKPYDLGLSQFLREEPHVSKRPELTSARIVISGGRGLQSGENFKMLEEIADKLGAALGATRAAVDAGFVPNDYQIGQTGKVVAPDLYIAVGISGAIQHLAGHERQ